MMFLHAMSECDSTSSLYNQGKTKFLKTFSKYPNLKEIIGKFLDPSAQPTAIAAAEEKLVALYGANHLTTSLNALRYKQYVTSAYKFSSNIASVSPTDAADYQHSLRVACIFTPAVARQQFFTKSGCFHITDL
ncbi:unnamed protein product [Psylliodes chrysocephalus]|uniref:Uncharacterized protein n=1 Tax=Psylliodes chrysocephalus TaxID=3402493 RepID=A0A9P0CN58_9CUCU|nr:unnamed protein product [Psylliodes chrysocephala]